MSLIVFVTFLALYTATLLPDLLPADAGEFQLVGATAGVAHPPGYTLYTMVGWLFAHLPLGPTAAWRVSLFSAVTSAATAALTCRAARRLTGSGWGGLAAALTLGSATTFWATATSASIRPLTGFFTVLCFHALIKYRLAITDSNLQSDRLLILLALAFSLGLTHHPSLIFPASTFIVYLILVDPDLLRQPRRWLRPIAAFALGMLVLVYLPLRGPSDLATVSGFLEYVLARGFRGDMFALNLLDRLVLLPTLLRFQFNPVLILGALFGALLLLWRDRKLVLLLVGSFVVHTAVTLTYDAPQTVEYEMPAYVSLALLAAIPFGGMLSVESRVSNVKSEVSNAKSGIRYLQSTVPAICHLCCAIILFAGVVNLAAHFPSYRALSESRDARRYAESLLREAPADAVILSNWHWATPMWYLQQVEGRRPDIVVKYVAPRGQSLARNWVTTIEEWLPQRPVVVVRYFEREYDALPYRFEPLGEAFLVRAEPRFAAPAGLTPLDIALGQQIKLLGYRLERDRTEPACPLKLTLAWSPSVTPTTEVALFAQLLGPEGRLWSAAQDRRYPPARFVAGEVVVERFVVYPLLHAPLGDQTLVVGAYLPGEPGAPRLTTAEGADAVHVTTVRLQAATRRPVTRHPLSARFAGGPTLIGVDYDTGVLGQVRIYLHWAGSGGAATLELLDKSGTVVGRGRVCALERGEYATNALDILRAPDRLKLLDGARPRRWKVVSVGSLPLPPPTPGERWVPFADGLVLTGVDGPAGDLRPGADVTLGLHFRSQCPLERDYVVSAALTGLNPDGSWVWRDAQDSVPALGAMPTLKWIRGSVIFDPHRVTVPGDARPTPVSGSLVIYDHFTQAGLPSLDERLGPEVPLGSWAVGAR